MSANANTNIASIAAHATLVGERMVIADVVDRVKPFERAAAAPRFSWLAPAGGLLLGAGVGALLAGRGLDAVGVDIALVAGALLLIFGRVFGWARSENLEAICHDFCEYLQRWPDVMGPPPMSEEYERLVRERTNRRDWGFKKTLWWWITR